MKRGDRLPIYSIGNCNLVAAFWTIDRHRRHAKNGQIQLMRALLKLVCLMQYGGAGRIERHADKVLQLISRSFT